MSAVRLSEKQRKAIEFIIANPGATPDEVVAAAGASASGSNGAEFIWRLLASGNLRLEVEPDLRLDIEEGLI